MTEIAYSPDGTTVSQIFTTMPQWHWLADTESSGEFVTPTLALGYFPLERTPRPPDTDTQTYDASFQRVGDTFVEQWTARDWTDAELAARAPSVVDVLAAQAVAEDNENPPLWVQPTGAHDAYLPGAIVRDAANVRWINTLTVPNVWALTGPNAHGWRVDTVVPPGPQPWVQPTGSHDAYNDGDRVTHIGFTWQSAMNGNVWEPGTIAQWVVVP